MPDDNTRDDAGRMAELRAMIGRKGKPTVTIFQCDIKALFLELDARAAALRDAQAEIEKLRSTLQGFSDSILQRDRVIFGGDTAEAEIEKLEAALAAKDAVVAAAREAYAKFTENGTPVLKTDEHLPEPYWSPSGKMMRSGSMMAIGEALARLDAVPDPCGWRLIDDAAKDGNEWLFWSHLNQSAAVCFWDDEKPHVYKWQTADGAGYHQDLFTHYRSIPAPPAAPREEGEG